MKRVLVAGGLLLLAVTIATARGGAVAAGTSVDQRAGGGGSTGGTNPDGSCRPSGAYRPPVHAGCLLPKGWDVSGVSESGTIGTERTSRRAFVSLINLNAANSYRVTIRGRRAER
jgi:hypothetical protein